jgi:serine/threonine-protein kinase
MCAIKVIRQSFDDEDWDTLSDPEDAVARFRIEALAASRLDHPNVLRVLDYGCEPEDGLWFLVTEHLDGEDLADLLAAHGPLPSERAAGMAREVCAALQHAHKRGVIHRDVKPRNVRVVRREDDEGQEQEHVKLLDFGTAMLTAGPGMDRSSDQILLGTPAYMSPEQASGQSIDGRSDIYACGVLLFEMVAGRLPFERSSPLELAAAHIHVRPPRPRSIQSSIDPELEGIILKCLRKDPADRPQSARELREALGRLLGRQAAGAPPDEPPISELMVNREDTACVWDATG